MILVVLQSFIVQKMTRMLYFSVDKPGNVKIEVIRAFG